MSSKNKLLGAALEENRVRKKDSIFLAFILSEIILMARFETTFHHFQNLAESNADLGKKIEDMKEELKEGRIEIERTTDDYLKLKVRCW